MRWTLLFAFISTGSALGQAPAVPVPGPAVPPAPLPTVPPPALPAGAPQTPPPPLAVVPPQEPIYVIDNPVFSEPLVSRYDRF
jgi:hypothetical protein